MSHTHADTTFAVPLALLTPTLFVPRLELEHTPQLIHRSPFLDVGDDTELRAGMVSSIEPGL